MVRAESSSLPPSSLDLERDRTQVFQEAASETLATIPLPHRRIITPKLAWAIGLLVALVLAAVLIL